MKRNHLVYAIAATRICCGLFDVDGELLSRPSSVALAISASEARRPLQAVPCRRCAPSMSHDLIPSLEVASD
jgi:hypothetical protein